MSEIEQLKADLAAFERVRECSGKYGFNHGPGTVYAIAKIEAKIKELESQNDWTETQKLIADYKEYTSKGNDKWKIFEYAIHLEDEVERLKAELENRPVVWCLKTSTGSLHTSDVNNTTRLFHSMTDALSYAAKHNYHWLKADTYTGKESE